MEKILKVIILKGVISTTRAHNHEDPETKDYYEEKIKGYSEFAETLKNLLLTFDVSVEIENDMEGVYNLLKKSRKNTTVIFISKAMKMQAIGTVTSFPETKAVVFTGSIKVIEKNGPILYIPKDMTNPFSPLLDFMKK
jgi:hypothetical protein